MRLCYVPALLLSLSVGCSRTAQDNAQTPENDETLTVPVVVAEQTLVGFSHTGPPPWPRGNCLSLMPRKVANMHAENFKEAVKKFQLETVKILPIGDGHCVIVDERIPKQWLLEKPCRLCTPESLRRELEKSHADRFQ
jgi:hypothetical protein